MSYKYLKLNSNKVSSMVFHSFVTMITRDLDYSSIIIRYYEEDKSSWRQCKRFIQGHEMYLHEVDKKVYDPNKNSTKFSCVNLTMNGSENIIVLNFKKHTSNGVRYCAIVIPRELNSVTYSTKETTESIIETFKEFRKYSRNIYDTINKIKI